VDISDTEDLVDLSPQESAALIRGILSNRLPGSPAENLVLLNAAASLMLAGRAVNLVDGVDIARSSIRSGDAMVKLGQLAEVETV
jgi:anthranilate phosphoribosyltransferase